MGRAAADDFADDGTAVFFLAGFTGEAIGVMLGLEFAAFAVYVSIV